MAPDRDKSISTAQRALDINLNDTIYGTIVEIGAGQEVARQFFSAGAAAGTIAKTASAYDMRVSDEIYGKAERYVSRERVDQMLTHEFGLLIERLQEQRDPGTRYFSYAATVTARSYSQHNECHGWVGLLYQLEPRAEPSEIILHVRMLDDDNQSQSEALGVLGVNLIHAAFNYFTEPKWIIEALLDNLDTRRLEIDLIHFSGPYFEDVENRLMNLHLVHSWCCRAVMFDANGESVVPAAALRKKDVLVLRGSFKPPTLVHVDMTESALRQFEEQESLTGRGISVVAEITMSELASDDDEDDAGFLARVDLLSGLGYDVLISDYLRYFRLRSWIRRYTQSHIGIVLSCWDFTEVFDEKYYDGLEGGALEAMGKLFSDDTSVYVYPALIDGELVTLENVRVDESLRYLLRHLVINEKLIPVREYHEENLHIDPAMALSALRQGRGDWEQQVPPGVAEEIVSRGLFGYGSKD